VERLLYVDRALQIGIVGYLDDTDTISLVMITPLSQDLWILPIIEAPVQRLQITPLHIMHLMRHLGHTMLAEVVRQSAAQGLRNTLLDSLVSPSLHQGCRF
jgi:hypothetical protein